MGKFRAEVYCDGKYVNGHDHDETSLMFYIEEWKKGTLEEVRITRL